MEVSTQQNNFTVNELIMNHGDIRKNYHFSDGHVVSFSSHSLERIEGRCGIKDREVFQHTAVKIANIFCKKLGVQAFRRIGSRVAVRSEKEGMIVILSLQEKISESDYTIAVVTVWNTSLGEFFFRRGMTIYDVKMSLMSGYHIEKAVYGTFKLQSKFYWE